MSDSLAEQLRGAHIKPFWRRIPQFFLYPLYPRPLLLLLALSALSLLTPLVAYGWLLVLVLAWVPFLRYAYSVLERTAYGILSPQQPYSSSFGQYRPWKQMLILALALLLAGVVYGLVGRVAGYVVLYGLLFLLPANIMWLTRTDSLLASINPLVIADLVRSIGWPYLGLCGLIVALGTANNAATLLLFSAFQQSPWVFPATTFISMYFTLIMYNMMGYVLYQFHEPLGLHPLHAPLQSGTTFGEQVRELQGDPAALDAELQKLAAEGRVGDAVLLLAALLRRAPGDLRLHERYHRALRLAGEQDKWRQHGSEYIGLLLQDGQERAALRAYEDCIRVDPGMRLSSARTQVALARAARGQGQLELASNLLVNFDLLFPDSSEQPHAYFLAAQLLYEDFGESSEARKLLEYVASRHAADPVAAQARRYLQAMSR